MSDIPSEILESAIDAYAASVTAVHAQDPDWEWPARRRIAMRAAAVVILAWAEERHGQEMMILSKEIETMRQEADAIHAKILDLHALTMKQVEGEDALRLDADEHRPDQMTLGQLIDAMVKAPQHLVVMFDNGSWPERLGSHREYYDHLAIEPGNGDFTDTVADWHSRLSSAVGDTFKGYKGGEFRMHRDTPLWCSEWGDASDVMIVGAKVVGGNFVIMTWRDDRHE